MKPLNGWEQTAAATGGSFEQVPPGGHVCIIKGARVEPGQYGDRMILAYDIKEGSQYDGFYQRTYNRISENKTDAKWPGTHYQSVETKNGAPNPFFKGLIQAVEKSNSGFMWNWDETALKGKLVGFVFQEQEYLGQDGSIKSNTRPAWADSVESIRKGVPVPERKAYSGGGAAASSTGSAASSASVITDNDTLPF